MAGPGAPLGEQERAVVGLRVQPRPLPSSLPVVLGSSSRHRRAVMEALGWQVGPARGGAAYLRRGGRKQTKGKGMLSVLNSTIQVGPPGCQSPHGPICLLSDRKISVIVFYREENKSGRMGSRCIKNPQTLRAPVHNARLASFLPGEPLRPPQFRPHPLVPALMLRPPARDQFSTASPDIDEKAIRDPDPRKMCAKIARAKAEALVGRLDGPGLLITSDQVSIFYFCVIVCPKSSSGHVALPFFCVLCSIFQ